MLVINNIPMNTIGYSFWNDFLEIVHVRNRGAAFSMGDSVPEIIRVILFIVIPLAVLIALIIYIIRVEGHSMLQIWCMAGILGGGLGNMMDRIFRHDGVVDFVSVKFYGLFGMPRFPVFNVADSSIVVFGILLLITFFVEGAKKNEQKA